MLADSWLGVVDMSELLFVLCVFGLILAALLLIAARDCSCRGEGGESMRVWQLFLLAQ